MQKYCKCTNFSLCLYLIFYYISISNLFWNIFHKLIILLWFMRLKMIMKRWYNFYLRSRGLISTAKTFEFNNFLSNLNGIMLWYFILKWFMAFRIFWHLLALQLNRLEGEDMQKSSNFSLIQIKTNWSSLYTMIVWL